MIIAKLGSGTVGKVRSIIVFTRIMFSVSGLISLKRLNINADVALVTGCEYGRYYFTNTC